MGLGCDGSVAKRCSLIWSGKEKRKRSAGEEGEIYRWSLRKRGGADASEEEKSGGGVGAVEKTK